jgi:hypothetical protein
MKGLKSTRRRLIVVISGVVVVIVVALVLVFCVFKPFTSPKKSEAEEHGDDLSSFIAQNPLIYRSASEDLKHEEFNSALAKQVASDGKITQEELQEVKAAYIKCDTDLGFTVESLPDTGGATINFNTAEEANVAEDSQLDIQCDKDNDWTLIMMAYQTQVHDPEDLPYGEVFYNCLVSQGAVKKSEMSYEEFEMLKYDGYKSDMALPNSDGYMHCLTEVPY